MIEQAHHTSEQVRASIRWAVIGAWIAIVGICFILILQYNAQEKIRALRLWEQRLAIAADHQASQIDELMGSRTKSLRAIADNVSTRLYLTTVNNASSAAESEADLSFLRNYIFAIAEQTGLAPKDSDTASIPANVAVEADRGVAIVHADGKPVVATRHFPDFNAVIEQLLMPDITKPLNRVGPIMDGGHANNDGRIWIAVPIYAVQEDAGASRPIGWVIGTFLTLDAFDDVLAKGELPDTPATSLLVGNGDGTLHIISPRDKRELPLESTQYHTLAAQAHAEHDRLLSGMDAQHRAAFAFAAGVSETGWSVVREVTRKAALADTEKRGMRLTLLFLLAVTTITVGVIALWRHVTTQRLQHLLKNIQNHEQLLELVTEHIPARLFIIDDQFRYRYANREAAGAARMMRADIRGKTLIQALGAAAARPYMEISARVLQRGVTETVVQEKSGETGLESASRVQYVPLDDLPESYAEGGQAVLAIEQDLTEVMQAKYAHQQSLKKLIDTVVALADKRDPNAAHHSAGVALIAQAIAETLHLDHLLINTAAVAGQLMNLGKLFIPQDLLTSQKQIEREDKQLIAQSLKMAIEHLADVPFDGPVIETLRQAQEKPDGSGPLGFTEQNTLITAKVVSVANSFVALTSRRSYRKQLSISEAISVLQKGSGSAYAPAVVTALAHYIENLGGEERWAAFLGQQR